MKMHVTWLLATAFLMSVGLAAQSPAPPAQPSIKTLTITSPTLHDGEPMPQQHTPDGRNISPALNWSGVPSGTRELMVFCEDPGVGNPPPFVHWVVYNIPGTATGLPEGLPIDPTVPMPTSLTGAKQGLSGFRRVVYRGPAPPPGRPHMYHFVVYALGGAIVQKPGMPPPTRAELLDLAKGHIIGRGELVATYTRQ